MQQREKERLLRDSKYLTVCSVKTASHFHGINKTQTFKLSTRKRRRGISIFVFNTAGAQLASQMSA